MNPIQKTLEILFPISCRDIRSGVSIGVGWLPIVAEALLVIENQCRMQASNGIPLERLPKAVQIKEKFGGLRLYTSSGNETIWAVVDKAEALSYKICESCGCKAKNSSSGGWWRTLCRDCDKRSR